MNALRFAFISLVRQPARSSLGILGVAAVGALLFDMLLLSEGLVTSMRDLFDRAGFDLRVTATDALPGQGPALPGAVDTAVAISQLPSVRAAVALRFVDAVIDLGPGRREGASLHGAGGGTSYPWTVLRGRDLQGPGEVLVNERTADRLDIELGTVIGLRASCLVDIEESLPPVTATVVGIAEFPFETPFGTTVASRIDTLDTACGGNDAGSADVVMVASREGSTSDEAAAAISELRPELRVLTNEELVGRFEQGGFSYFRQISTVLTTVTVAFAVLLITVLLTVSVNQRLGEIAALRALGFTRGRVIADVLWESTLVVGAGALLSLPLGGLLAIGLDAILKRIPGIPTDVHFFVYRDEALVIHGLLLAATAVIAALYPMRIVARLPIAGTLRDEVAG
ncbi:MAG: ABC transporter permease [Vicinamibacterales bacterium]